MKMESNDELKKMRWKTVLVFILMKKLNLKIFVLVYDISCKSLIGAKPLRVRFDFGNGFISVYDTSRYLVLFSTDKYDAIYNSIRYLLSLKNGTTYVIYHSYARNTVDSFDSFTLEKPIAFQNVITLITSVFNKNKYHYYYNIFWEKDWNQSPENNNK